LGFSGRNLASKQNFIANLKALKFGDGAAIWLNVMHVVAGLIIIPMVAKALPAQRQS